MDCIFCKIVDGSIPSTKVYEDDKMLAFKDINPQAPVHIVMIPKQHISSANDINEENCDIIAHIFKTIPKIAEKLELKDGYRIISNCGSDAGQTVFHLHFHLLGGKSLGEKLV